MDRSHARQQQTQQAAHPHLLIKFKKERSLDRSVNIFESAQEEDKTPSPLDHDFRLKRYSVVGDRLFVDKLMEQYTRNNKPANDVEPPSLQLTSRTNQLEMTMGEMHSRLMNTTHNHSQFQSRLLMRLSKQEQLSYTREKRNIELFKARQRYWNNSPEPGRPRAFSQDIKKSTLNPIDEHPRIYIEPNQDQQAAIVNNPTGYWKKSLRNNDKELLKYIAGVPYDKVELEKLLQTEQGIRKIEAKVPQLNLEVIKKTQQLGGLTVSARSKGKSQFEACQSSSSVYRTERYPEHFEEVYKVDWNKRDLARRNLPMLPKMQLKQF